MLLVVIVLLIAVLVLQLYVYYRSRRSKGSVTSARVTALYIHPIKSCRGVSVQEAATDELGFVNDRRLCLVDLATNKYVTLRENPALARLQPTINGDNDLVIACDDVNISPFVIPLRVPNDWWDITGDEWEHVQIGRTKGRGRRVGGAALTTWLARALDTGTGTNMQRLKLMRLHDNLRHVRDQSVDPKWRDLFPSTYQTSPFKSRDDGRDLPLLAGWHDGSPFLLTRTESLDALNDELKTPVTMARFRGNIVTTGGGGAWAEDRWTTLRFINATDATASLTMQNIKPCGRCVTLLADPQGGGRATDGEPLVTLRRLRHVTNVMPQSSSVNKQTYADTPLFGANLRHIGRAHGVIRVGDLINIHVSSKSL